MIWYIVCGVLGFGLGCGFMLGYLVWQATRVEDDEWLG